METPSTNLNPGWPLARQLARDGGRLLLGRCAGVVALLVGMRLVTQVVPPEVYGGFSLAIAFVLLAQGVCGTPLVHAVLRFYPELAARGGTGALRGVLAVWGRRIVLGVVVAATVLGGAAIAWKQLTPGVVLLMTALVLVYFQRELQTCLLNAARRHGPFVVWEAAEELGRPAWVLLIVLLAGASIEGLLAAYLLASLIPLAAAWWLLPPTLEKPATDEINPDDQRRLAERMLSYLWPLATLPILLWLTGLGDRYAIGWLVGFEQVGVYAAVYGLMSQPFLMAARVTRMTFSPVYLQAVSAHDARAQASVFRSWLITSLVISAGGVAGALLLREAIAGLLLAEVYRSGADLMPWIAAGNALLLLARVYEAPLQAAKRTGWLLATQLSGAAAMALVTGPLVYWQGVRGAAVACVIYFGAQLLVTIALARRATTRALDAPDVSPRIASQAIMPEGAHATP